MASPQTPTAITHEDDRKGIRTSPSISSGRGSNVVDHLAPGVTENVPHHGPRRNPNDNIITVHPLRKDEMQVRLSPPRFRQSIVLMSYSRVTFRTLASELSSTVSMALSSMFLVLLLVALAPSLAFPARTHSARSSRVRLLSPAYRRLNQAFF